MRRAEITGATALELVSLDFPQRAEELVEQYTSDICLTHVYADFHSNDSNWDKEKD